jgi:metal-responsive CopG/Arc/MetJ family transcriptional regulator
MATVNFSVPDEVKEAFDKTFGDQNKSAVIAKLMRRAVDEHQLQKRREQLFRQLTNARARRPTATADQIAKARSSGRS